MDTKEKDTYGEVVLADRTFSHDVQSQPQDIDDHNLKVDQDSIPPTPQLASHPSDPLNWPKWQRTYVVLTVSVLGFMNQLGSALINPAFVQMSRDLSITVPQASYCTTTFILFSGLTSMFAVPYTNVYGRRILYLVFGLVGIAAQFGSGAAASYGGVVAGRVFYGIGGSIPLGIGAATICDLFPQGERGLYMGVYTLCVNNGPHIAPIIGGYIALNLSWRWCFYVPGIASAGLWVVMFFTFRETLFSRGLDGADKKRETRTRAGVRKLWFQGKILARPIRLRAFVTPYRMCRYWAVSLPSMYWMTANTYGSALFAVTGSHIASSLYSFNVAQTGLLMGLPLTIGCMVGEATAGWVSDGILNAYARRHGGDRGVFAFNVGFYALPFGEGKGYNVAFPVLAMINAITILPLVWLWFNGERIRERQGSPRMHEDL
ncbi:hypothetical protein M8818_005213 [Zalaria obscura]|uniref:Uncharacterized protein n=1 Tax=Zalaria obscura TaxID=2024903 RepID=A0ACC3SB90_9PEZI